MHMYQAGLVFRYYIKTLQAALQGNVFSSANEQHVTFILHFVWENLPRKNSCPFFPFLEDKHNSQQSYFLSVFQDVRANLVGK